MENIMAEISARVMHTHTHTHTHTKHLQALMHVDIKLLLITNCNNSSNTVQLRYRGLN